MYSQQALSRQRRSRSMRRNRDFNAHRASKALGPVTSTMFLVMIIGVLSLLYLTQVTKTSTHGYEINALEQKQETLVQQQQQLEVEAARLRSVGRVEDSQVASELEPETSVMYDSR